MGRKRIRNFGIVGSGVAGLTCAIRLTGSGVDCRVYEKSRGPGGRLAAMRTDDGSVDMGAQFFTVRNERFRHFLAQYAGTETFAPWEQPLLYQKSDLSVEPFHSDQRFVGKPRMSAVTRALSNHADIHYRTRIESLEQDADGWWLIDGDGHHHGPHDGVIVTAPPAQAAHVFGGNAGLRQALAGYHMVPCWAVALRFAQSLKLGFGAMQVAHPLMRWVACDSTKPERSHTGDWWVIHARPDWTGRNLSLDGTKVVDILVDAFREHLSVTARPDRAHAHRWMFAQPVNPAGPGHLWDDEANLGVCGDYLDGGRVEGAFNSAESLLSHLRVGDRLGGEPV